MIKYLFCLSLLLISGTAFGQIPDYSQYTRAQLEEKVSQGDAQAMYTLGLYMIFDSEMLPLENPNIDTAIKYLKKAEKANHEEAASILGLLHFGEFGGPLKPKKGKKYLLGGAERGFASSKANFIVRFAASPKSEDQKKVFTYLSSLRKHPEYSEIVLPELMRIYSFGNDATEINLEKGRAITQECVEIVPKAIECQYMMARYLQNGWGGEANISESTQYFQRAAEAGMAPAQWYVGMAYINGRGVKVDLQEAYRWVEKSAENEYLDGLLSYGAMNATGEGTSVDYSKAFTSYEKAAKMGNYHALRSIGGMYFQGEGRPADKAMGAAAFILASENNDDQALLLMQQFFGEMNDSQYKKFRRNHAVQISTLKKTYGFD